ncbi:type VII secretion protein EccB [Nocardia exalbida]|uniref:type VII secretion protein EccB n=1 Tax=Nocardia exalbida TaxID=290231 RepID=UPI00030B1085|nr:type VII secretion protein EccB [Nocardia exalbida]
MKTDGTDDRSTSVLIGDPELGDKASGRDKESGVTPEPAPWPIVGLLASGPALSREGAMVDDGVAPDSSPARQPVASAK